MRTSSPIGLAALVVALAALPACSFKPQFAENKIRCGANMACPAGFHCSEAGFCCQTQCPGSEEIDAAGSSADARSPSRDGGAQDVPVTSDGPVGQDGNGGAKDGNGDGPTVDTAPPDPGCAASCTGGTCRNNQCCRGCWNGTRCETGTEVATCGTGGGDCAKCDDSNVCTQDACTAGSCNSTGVSGPCPTGVCVSKRCECGDQGQPCCASGPLCKAPLACTGAAGTGTCGTCGGPNQPCCASAPLCSGSNVCAGGMCVKCGSADARCCAGNLCDPNLTCNAGGTCACGSQNEACCGGTTCSSSSNKCSGGRCVHCGAKDEPCCSSTPTCGSSLSCSGGICRCGGTNQPCCGGAGGTCSSSGNICGNGICIACGGQGQACCGSSCTGSGTQCRNGVCEACGARNQPCCTANPMCGSNLTCGSQSTCECGGPNQPCCGGAGGTCTSNMNACSSGTCVPCGGVGQPCCGACPWKRVFITSAVVDGSMHRPNDPSGNGGISGADQLCQTLGAKLPSAGTFKAWLTGHGIIDNTSPSVRMTHATIPYVLANHTKVADNWSDLTDGTLAHSIDRDENNQQIVAAAAPVASFGVWTNTTASGTQLSDNDCSVWTSASTTYVGTGGNNQVVDGSWTAVPMATVTCEVFKRIYCVEQ